MNASGACGGPAVARAPRGRSPAGVRSAAPGLGGGSTRHGGAAAVELIAIAPFVVLLMAALWDLRAFTAFRTDIAREQYAVAELIAGGDDWANEQAVGSAVRAAMNRLARRSAGTMRVVVVTRLRDQTGPPVVEATNSAGRDCDTAWDHDSDPATDDQLPWCEPMLLNEIRPNPDPDATSTIPTWNGGGDCAGLPSQLPANEGDSFGASDPVLPQEGTAIGGTTPPASAWVSRTLTPTEWWVVVEICAHFGRGSETGFSGGALVNLGLRTLGMPTTMRRRVAWGALEALDDCAWCVPPAPATPPPP